MSMSLPIFDALIGRFPAEREAIARLAELLAGRRSREYALDQLVLKLEPESPVDLAAILAELTSAGLVRRIVRVESPTGGGGIADYTSVAEVPNHLHDWRADADIDVTPDRLRVFYAVD